MFQEERTLWGIISSPALVRAPEGNGCAARFIRPLKEHLLWLKTFDPVEERRRSVLYDKTREVILAELAT